MTDLANDLRDGAITEFGLYAKAATAAAYEVAAKIFCSSYEVAEKHEELATSAISRALVEIRALATPDQTAALDKLIAEAEARVWMEAAKVAASYRNGAGLGAGKPCIPDQISAAILAASKKGAP